MLDDPTLECQACGRVLKRLSLAEAQRVAGDPYRFIVYCHECLREDLHIEQGFR